MASGQDGDSGRSMIRHRKAHVSDRDHGSSCTTNKSCLRETHVPQRHSHPVVTPYRRRQGLTRVHMFPIFRGPQGVGREVLRFPPWPPDHVGSANGVRCHDDCRATMDR
nr:hypothetical protein CFP56_09131 [Quercus suber]